MGRGEIMRTAKTLLIVTFLLSLTVAVRADLVLTVNGMDTLMPIDVMPDDDIIIGVSGGTGDPSELFSVSCEVGGKLETLGEPNTLADTSNQIGYLFTFESEGVGLAMVNLTVGHALDYQLSLFNIPNAKTVIFGIDSDAVQTEPEPELLPKPKPNQGLASYEPDPVHIGFTRLPSRAMPYSQETALQEAEHCTGCPTAQADALTYQQFIGSMPQTAPLNLESIDPSWLVIDQNYIDALPSPIILWSPDKEYYVQEQITIGVYGLDPNGVEIPFQHYILPGTRIHYGSDGVLFYENDAKIVAGQGSSGSLDPNGLMVERIEMTAASGNYFNGYYAAIVLDETASTDSVLTNLRIEGSYIGLQLENISLNTPVMNNVIVGVYNGIVMIGPNKYTPIVNNQIYLFGYIGDGYYPGFYGHGIYVPTDGSGVLWETSVWLQNNTIFDGDRSICAEGRNDPNVVTINAVNNITARAYDYAYIFLNGSLGINVQNPGFYENNQKQNFGFDLVNQVNASSYPFEFAGDDLLLTGGCEFIDSGLGLVTDYPFLLGSVATANGAVDYGIADLGAHIFINSPKGYGIPRITDVNFDLVTDVNDVAGFSDYWLWWDQREPNNFPSFEAYEDFWDPNNLDPNDLDFGGEIFDFNRDTKVDFGDFSILSREFLQGGGFFESTLFVEFVNDVNNLQGVQDILIDGFRDETTSFQVNLDGHFIGSIEDPRILDGDEDPLDPDKGKIRFLLDSTRFQNGLHKLNVVGYDSQGNVEVSQTLQVLFRNLLSSARAGNYYTDEGYTIEGIYDGINDLKVKVVDRYQTVVYTRIISGSYVNHTIPPEVFSDGLWYDIKVSEVGSGMMAASEVPPYKEWKKKIYKKYDSKKYDKDGPERVLFLLPDTRVTSMRWDVITAEMEACVNQNIGYIVLFHHDVNHTNLADVFGRLRRLNTVFYHGHANSEVEGEDGTVVQRTHFQCWRLKQVNWWPDSYVASRAFSSFKVSEPLPDNWDTNGFSLWSYNLGFRLALFDGCLTGEYFDLANALCRNGARYNNRVFMGWRIRVWILGGILDDLSLSDEGLIEIANTLGRDDSVEDALTNSVVNVSGGARRELWGPDGFIDPDFYGDDRLRVVLWGSASNIYLGHGY